MNVKRSVILFLVGVNFILGAILLADVYSPAQAFAQKPAGRAGDFVSVTASAAGHSYSVLYILDVPNKKLHALYPPSVQTKQLSYGGFRDLEKDFPSP